MGRHNTVEEQTGTVAWAEGYRGGRLPVAGEFTLDSLKAAYAEPLKRYFALSGLSRSITAPSQLVTRAWEQVFRVRVLIEGAVQDSIREALSLTPSGLDALLKSSFFGLSKKQGISIRLPLRSCNPTPLCGSACYAHDVLDAGPESVVRGAVNGFLAALYESGEEAARGSLLARLRPHVRRAVRAATREARDLKGEWKRRPRIRFSHVGEIAFWPRFANALAALVRDLSEGGVDCVVYTRHQRAGELDPELFVINFTLDAASPDRRDWAPIRSRIVFSAFGGDLSADAEVNFLEHHRWSHTPARSGEGRVCPATLPETEDRTCDAVRCDRCFRQPGGLIQVGLREPLRV
jgi:hypothetical protein